MAMEMLEEKLSNSIDKYIVRKELRNLDTGGSGYELVLELRMQDTQFTSQKELIASVKSIDGVKKSIVTFSSIVSSCVNDCVKMNLSEVTLNV